MEVEEPAAVLGGIEGRVPPHGLADVAPGWPRHPNSRRDEEVRFSGYRLIC
jgi:hypothetical protein